MSYNIPLIAELQMEAASTAKMLARIPTDKFGWAPHEKSMKMGRLANHVAELPSWITMTMNTEVLDFANWDYKPAVATTAEELVAIHDQHVKEAVACLENATDADFEKMWTMRNGEQIYFTLPKKVVLRTWAFSHQYHHRGQLSVYLRLLDIPVPGMYGPSADDNRAPVAEPAPADNGDYLDGANQ